MEKPAGRLSTSNMDSTLESQPLNLVNGSNLHNILSRFNEKVVSIRYIEARGIERVPESERHSVTAADYTQMALLWFSTNITANNIAIGMLGPLDYGLSFLDSALCASFGALLGAAGAAYMGTWGPVSGNRTMVVARYFMGYYPSKICALLNIVIMLGYGTIDCLVGGQILSAVAGGKTSIITGTIIVAIITWVIVIFGMSLFHKYERWAWVPQIIALLVLVGSAGPKFDTNMSSIGSSRDVAGNRLSFFSLCLSCSISWAPAGADYYVYYPHTTKKWITFTMSFLGIGLAFIFAYLLGVGLGSGTFTNMDWAAANGISSGALIVKGYNSLEGFGRFLGLAALTSFVIGWVGSTLGMYQIYYVGPIAKLVSFKGADLGIWVGCSWAMLVFPPLRWLELKKFSR